MVSGLQDPGKLAGKRPSLVYYLWARPTAAMLPHLQGGQGRLGPAQMLLSLNPSSLSKPALGLSQRDSRSPPRPLPPAKVCNEPGWASESLTTCTHADNLCGL